MQGYNWCRTYKYDIERFDLGNFIDTKKSQETTLNAVGWYLYEDQKDFSEETSVLREELGTIFSNKLRYMGVWNYYPGFIDDLGPHIDGGNIENAVIFMCPRGELTVTLHDPETKEVLESKILGGNNILVLYHTKFMHDIEGIGDLVVFGLSQDFDAEMFFRADGQYYKRTELDYPVEDLLQEVMDLYPSEDKVSEWNYFPVPGGQSQYNWVFDPLPEHIKDAIERTTGETLVPGISYLCDYRNTGTKLDIHKDPRVNTLGPVPPLLTLVCLDGFSKLVIWADQITNPDTKILDTCIYGPGDVITFNATELYHSVTNLLPNRRKRNIHCYNVS